MKSVYIFQGNGVESPCAVFSKLETAENWIKHQSVSGTLTVYPLDISVIEWAVAMGYFNPKNDDQKTPEFIAGFTSVSGMNYHYEAGQRVGHS